MCDNPIKNIIDVDVCVPESELVPLKCIGRGLIMPNEIVVEDNINAALKEIYDEIMYLDSKNCLLYDYIEYYGWLGPEPTKVGLSACKTSYWEDIECNGTAEEIVTWEELECVVTAVSDPLVLACHKGKEQECIRTSCFGKYCTDWNWVGRNTANASTELPITWRMTRSDGAFKKLWAFESCDLADSTHCDEGYWNVNIPLIDDFYEPVGNCDEVKRCFYTGIASRKNILYVTGTTTVKVLSSDYDSTELGIRHLVDSGTAFVNIKGVAIDSTDKIFVLDQTLCKVASYKFDYTSGTPWTLISLWGGVGSAVSKNRFRSPSDIHIDRCDNVWIADTGNGCVKQYNNTGNWIQTITDTELVKYKPISMAVDEKDRVHVLSKNNVRVYNYTGTFLFSYNIDKTQVPIKINTNFNKQILYITYKTFVRKYVRTGVAFGYLFKDKTCVNHINSVYQDEYRNTLVTFGDKIIKYVHILKQRKTKSPLPSSFWALKDLLIDREEYIQNWVYNKSFQRMWDNIEMFRLSLSYDGTYCKGYKPPIYKKEDIHIGQNEIVTSIVINRCLGYLWENLCSIVNLYFDPFCKEPEVLNLTIT